MYLYENSATHLFLPFIEIILISLYMGIYIYICFPIYHFIQRPIEILHYDNTINKSRYCVLELGTAYSKSFYIIIHTRKYKHIHKYTYACLQPMLELLFIISLLIIYS